MDCQFSQYKGVEMYRASLAIVLLALVCGCAGEPAGDAPGTAVPAGGESAKAEGTETITLNVPGMT